MRGEQTFPTNVAKVVCTRLHPLTHFHLTDFSETSSLQRSDPNDITVTSRNFMEIH